jgi:cardiolipin synthase
MPLHHLPNVLTVTRIVAVVPLVWLMWTGHYWGALAVAMLAGVSDMLDGQLARRFGWQSQFGGWADPAADKVLMSASYVTLTLMGVLPVWLTVLVIFRDAIIAGGAVLYRALFGQFKAQPTLWSKATTLAQVLLIWLELVILAGLPVPQAINSAGVLIVGGLTVLTLIQYVWLWSHRARHMAQTLKGAS